VVRLQPATRPDAEEPGDAELDELLEDDRRARAAHARSLDRHALPFPGARIAEQPALGVDLGDVRQVRLGDVLRPQGIAGEETRVGIIARLGTEVDRHARKPIGGVRGALS
jgi:hypothetical protein